MNGIISKIKDLYMNRQLIWNLSKNDFKTQYAGSYLGIVWAFIQPIVTIMVYWFVFEKGLKATGVNTKEGIQVPFLLWFMAGLVPWFFFAEAWGKTTNVLIDYSYLVKKVVFNINILPFVKVISALFVHVFFVCFMLIVFLCYGYKPNLYWLQLIYYSFCMISLVLGLSFITSAMVVFFKDLGQIIGIVLQIGMWMTPIMWNIEAMNISPMLRIVFKLNPMYYVVFGYRDSLINQVFFFEHLKHTLYFWCIVIVLIILGVIVFKKLKIHFADVL